MDPLILKTIAVGVWIALLFAAERAAPAAIPAAEARGWRRVGRNAGLWAFNAALSPLIVIPVSAWAASLGFGWRPGWLAHGGGRWAPLFFDILLLDALLYAWHRLNHESQFLWRFHEVHHLDRHLDVTSAVRFHFGEVLLSALFRAAAIVLFAIPLTSVLVFEALVLAAAAFHHSNLRLPAKLERALSFVVVTPSIHWIHHHRRRADTDSNYATLFSWWDPIFRTRSRTARTPDMPIGVEGREEGALPDLLARPFSSERRNAKIPPPLRPECRY